MFEVRNIAFSYGDECVLKDVSFVGSPGEVVSIIGANGVGKTTLLKVLATLAVPQSGMVLVDGHDAYRQSLLYRRHIGYLPEKPALYDDMLVKEYLMYRAAIKGETPKRIRRRIGEAAETCMITNILRSQIRSLSFGMKKRVAMADAMLLRPRVMLLDDLMAGLDESMRSAMGGILREMAAFSSVIVTGHELDCLSKWSTRFLVLANGVISATITTAGVAQDVLRERLECALKGGA